MLLCNVSDVMEDNLNGKAADWNDCSDLTNLAQATNGQGSASLVCFHRHGALYTESFCKLLHAER